MSFAINIANIFKAPRSIDPVFLDTPTVVSAGLDAALGCRVLAKVETGNPVHSFKGRGTEWFASTVPDRREALVCASAGNFGQGLARAATQRGHACIVFVAETANPVKVRAIREFGAEIRSTGADFDAAKHAARCYAHERGMRWVEDGAEPALAEGAGTIALELVSANTFDVVVVPLGNGALLAGVGTVLHHLAPHTRIIAVVAEQAPAMKCSLEAGRVIETEHAHTIADGIAVRVPIPQTLELLRSCCDTIVTVSEAAIFGAMQLIQRHLDLVIEPAGATGIAALLADPRRYAGQRVATILSGGNLSDAMRTRLLVGHAPSLQTDSTPAPRPD